MSNQIDIHDSLERLLSPVVDCFTPDVAQRVTAIPVDPALQQRIDELAEKANEGELTESEAAEYDGWIYAMDVLAIIQAMARTVGTKV